jgi:hypothetical protein
MLYSKVVFVAHSLGGNIALEYYVHVATKYGHTATSRFPLIISLGTPFAGSFAADVWSLVSRNQQVRSLIRIQNNAFIQLLNNTRKDIVLKRSDNFCSPLDLDAVFETEPVGVTQIVSRESATKDATRVAGDGFGTNHLDLPTPTDRRDKVYEWVSQEIALCADGQDRCKPALHPGPVC